ncbi:MAG: toprim domain-containing protein, partial [Pseudomonadota bacterium]|nr:toprim domain-containing protein [Pseudomonadota bacterium]
LVTEGYMDVVALAQWGFPNAVATLGTACTPDHVQKLFRFTDSVVFSFDGDNAGRRAARKALDGALGYATDVRSIKFLFLPQEHDPDSFIREKGSESFSQCVAQATPLSKFLIEVASDGCDLQSAEGRAHLSSNASPLWRALPDGALKRQLLTELAQLIQLDPAELAGLWLQQAEAAAARSQPRGGVQSSANQSSGRDTQAYAADAAYDPEGQASPFESTRSATFQKSGSRSRPDGKTWQKDANGKWRLVGGSEQPLQLGPRTPLANRADHAVRLVLTNMALWDTLSAEDHALLCDLPGEHGELMRWIESQFHDHGPLAWGTLQSEIQNQAFAHLAAKLMGGHLPVEPGAAAELEPGEAHKEVRMLLNLMLIDQLKVQETAALKEAESGQDPAAYQRWRELHQRRKSLIGAQIP